MTTRRAFLTASLAASALAVFPQIAAAQPTAIGGIRVLVSPLVQEGWGYHVPAIKAGLERELTEAFGPALRRGGPLLVVSVESIWFSSFAGGGGGLYGGTGGANNDTLTSDVTLIGPGNRVIAAFPGIRATMDAGMAGAWYRPDIDQRRLAQLLRANAAWIKRYVAG